MEEVSEPPSESVHSLPHDGVRWPVQLSQHTGLNTEYLPGLNIPEAVVRGQVMPGLTSLLEVVQEVAPEMETAVLQVMSEMIMMMILIMS